MSGMHCFYFSNVITEWSVLSAIST